MVDTCGLQRKKHIHEYRNGFIITDNDTFWAFGCFTWVSLVTNHSNRMFLWPSKPALRCVSVVIKASVIINTLRYSGEQTLTRSQQNFWLRKGDSLGMYLQGRNSDILVLSKKSITSSKAWSNFKLIMNLSMAVRFLCKDFLMNTSETHTSQGSWFTSRVNSVKVSGYWHFADAKISLSICPSVAEKQK